MASPIIITWPSPDPAYFCATQAVTENVPLTFASTCNPQIIQNIFTGAVTYSAPMPPQNLRSVTLTSTEDASGIDFTVTGDDGYGNVLTQTKAGPDADIVYFGDIQLANVYSITPLGATTATVSAGTSFYGNTAWVQFDNYNKAAIYAISYNVTGTVYLTPTYVPYFTTFVNGKIVYNTIDEFESGEGFVINLDSNNVYSTPSGLSVPITVTSTIQTNGIMMAAFSTFLEPGEDSTGSFVCTISQQGAKY